MPIADMSPTFLFSVRFFPSPSTTTSDFDIVSEMIIIRTVYLFVYLFIMMMMMIIIIIIITGTAEARVQWRGEGGS